MVLKNAISIVFVLTLLFLLPGCHSSTKQVTPTANACKLAARSKTDIGNATSKLPNTVNPALFILPGNVYPLNSFTDILRTFLAEYPDRNIVIYIHGRGDEPSKAINDGLLEGLRAEYNLSPVMFTWASGKGIYPDEEAIRAGGDLKKVFFDLRDYKMQHSGSLKRTKFTLLTHSLGSFVLEGFLSGYDKGDLPLDLLDDVVINAPAASVDNHAEWVEKIDFSKQVFITYGHEDPMLTFAGFLMGKAALGKHGASQQNDKERMAANAVYVDFSQAISEHRYFVGNGDQACVYYFFTESLNGKGPDFTDLKFVTVSIPGRNYIVNK